MVLAHMNRSSRATAAIRELCGLGLPEDSLVPALLESLHELVPSSRNLLDRTDAAGRLQHYWFEGPVDPAIAQQYFEQFHNRREAEAMPAFADLVLQPAGVRSARELDHGGFFASALYHEIWRPQGLKYRVEAVLRGRDGALLGSLVLYRAPGERCFGADEEARLAPLLPVIAQALQAGAPFDDAAPWVDAPQGPESVVLDEQGHIAWATAGAFGLLALADGGLGPARLAQGHPGQPPALLRRLQLGLQAPGAGEAHAVQCGPQGRVRLHLQALRPLAAATAPAAEGCAPAALVTLWRLEPASVALERRLRQWSLTPGQHRVVRALAAGHSQAQAAMQLGVSTSSVIDQVRKVCRQLELRSIEDLRQRLRPADAHPGVAGAPGLGPELATKPEAAVTRSLV